MGVFEIVRQYRENRFLLGEVKRLEREAVARKAEHALHVESLDKEHRIDITEYEADLGAARSREEINLRKYNDALDNMQVLSDVLEGVKSELAKANEAWVKVSNELEVVTGERDHYRGGRKAAQENQDVAEKALVEVCKERDGLRRQVSQAREAHEKLYRALYPDLLDKTLRIDPDLKEKGERLREAGYGCATQKKTLQDSSIHSSQHAAAGYAGL